ncbi:MAG: hypothetical protein ACOYD4_09030 [Solirubrobacterales bacterium]
MRIVAPAAYSARVAAAGCEHRPLPPALELDPARGRGAEASVEQIRAAGG